MSNDKASATYHPYGGPEVVQYLEARRRANAHTARVIILLALVVVCIVVPVVLARQAEAQRQDRIDRMFDDMVITEVL